jgi:hypothetical protein
MRKTRIDREKLEQTSRLSSLEDDLRTIFKPVKPRSTYISESRTRLIRATKQKSSRLVALQLLVMAMALVASGVFILVLSVRTTITILGTLGLLHLVREQAHRKKAISTASHLESEISR